MKCIHSRSGSGVVLTSKVSAASQPEEAMAPEIRRVCAGPLGAVRPLDRPSWFTAEATMIAAGMPPRAELSVAGGASSVSAKPSPRPYLQSHPH